MMSAQEISKTLKKKDKQAKRAQETKTYAIQILAEQIIKLAGGDLSTATSVTIYANGQTHIRNGVD